MEFLWRALPVFAGWLRTLACSTSKELCGRCRRSVVIYSSNDDSLNQTIGAAPHVRHRRFTEWIESNAPGWMLLSHLPNRHPFSRSNAAEISYADFYIYQKAR